jgi:hypothetical protein
MHGLQGLPKKKTYPLSEPNSTLLPPSSKKPSTLSPEYLINKPPLKIFLLPLPLPLRLPPPANRPQQPSNDISELTALVKNLFDQMGTLLNLLTTVLTKLK